MADTIQRYAGLSAPSLQQDRTDFAFDMAEEDGGHVVNAPHDLPPEVMNLIRLENERAFRETGEMIRAIPAFVLEKYEIAGQRLKKISKKNEKAEYMRRFYLQMEEFFRHIGETFKKAGEVRAIYSAVKEEINSVLENLDSKDAEKLSPKAEQYKSELREIKETINTHRETLRRGENLDPSRVSEINRDLDAKTEEIRSIYGRFLRRLKALRGAEEEEAAPTLTDAMNDVAPIADAPETT